MTYVFFRSDVGTRHRGGLDNGKKNGGVKESDPFGNMPSDIQRVNDVLPKRECDDVEQIVSVKLSKIGNCKALVDDHKYAA